MKPGYTDGVEVDLICLGPCYPTDPYPHDYMMGAGGNKKAVELFNKLKLRWVASGELIVGNMVIPPFLEEIN